MSVEFAGKMNCALVVNVVDTPALVLTALASSNVSRLEYDISAHQLTVVPTNNPNESCVEVTNTAGLRNWKLASSAIVGNERLFIFTCLDLAGAAAAPVADNVHIAIWDIDPSDSVGNVTVTQVA